jgi:hypothetical protein
MKMHGHGTLTMAMHYFGSDELGPYCTVKEVVADIGELSFCVSFAWIA